MSFVFQTTRLHGARDRCADMARRWLIACSKDSCYWRSIAGLIDEQLADALIGAWGLDQPQGDRSDLSWFETHDADRSMLVEAFAELRLDLNKSA